jgi:hypothetical protein
MRRRNFVAALAVIAGGTLGAATPASASSAFTCLGAGPAADNIAPGVEVNVAFTGDFPEVVVGRRFAISPTVQYKLSNAYLKRLGEQGLLADGENRLGGMTFWVPIAASNTLEGRQIVRAVVNPTANTRVIWDAAASTVKVQRYTGQGAPNGSAMADLAGTATLSGGTTFWTPQSTAPVEFSAGSVGTLGALRVRDQWRRALDTSPAPADTLFGGGAPDVDPLVTTRAYGNLYWRLRLGANGRTSLDCLTGTATVLDSAIAYSEAGNAPVAEGGDRGRYTILGAAAPRFGVVTPRATPKTFTCLDGLGRYIGREINAFDMALSAPAPGRYQPGESYTLEGVEFTTPLPAVMLKGLYGTLFNYQSLPEGGVIDEPLRIWIALQGANTAERVQVALVEGRWQARFNDPDGVAGSGDETFPDVTLRYDVPDTTWTPTGAGPLSFAVAAPGQIPELTLFGFGHSGDAGAVFPMNPYGSIFVRAETGRYGESIDCLEGVIDIADPAIAWSNLGRMSPDSRIAEPVAPGAAPTGRTVAAGSQGRYSITHEPGAPFAIVPAVQAAPAPTPIAAPAPIAAKAAVRSSKLAVKQRRVAVSVGCTGSDCAGTVKVVTASRYKLGSKRRQVALTKAVKYSVAAGGRKSVKLALTTNGRSLLRRVKTLRVKVTVTTATGTAVTRTLTLRA